MSMLFRPAIVTVLRLLTPLGLALGWGSTRAGAGDADFFERRIRPVLVEHCYECHSEDSRKLKGGLKLDTRDHVLRGGDSGPVLTPGAPERSRLIEAVRYANRDLQMPPKGRLPDHVIADLEAWIRDGAEDPRRGGTPAPRETAAVVAARHWAFQPLRTPALPSPRSIPQSHHPIDAFIGQGLDTAGLTPTPPADRHTLIRRLHFDLTGLPPSPEEVQSFVSDPDPSAYDRRVDQLLASPRYGERWARWWLDLARYADSNGQDENKVMANAWRYRDWVVRSFNANLPFDDFTVQQLAGDLLPTNGVSEEELFDRWTATGLLVMGPKMLAEQDKPKLVMDVVDEQIDVVTRAFLGLTVGCARCHDHKFDPIPARDYYALAGIFKSTRAMENLDFVSKFNERPVSTRDHLLALEQHAKALAEQNRQLADATKAAADALQTAWEQRFPIWLAAAQAPAPTGDAASSTASPTPVEPSESERIAPLRALLSADPSTNAISRQLRELAAAPDTAPARLQEWKAARKALSGLRIGPGRVGGAFVGTGSNSLDRAHAPELDPAHLTVETWVRTAAFPREGDPRRWLVNKNGNEWEEGHYALVIDGDRPGAYLNMGGGKENVFAVWSEGPRLRTNHWHHLALTYDGDVLRLFVDGQPAGAAELHKPRRAGTGRLAVGRREDGYIHFRGSLDEIQVYDRALTADEITDRVRHPETPVERGVVARWDFNHLTDAERQDLERALVVDALWGAGGILTLPSDPRPHFPPATREALARLEAERDGLKSTAPPPRAFALAVNDDVPKDLPVYVRGNHLNPSGDPVPRGFIQVAYRGESPGIPSTQSGRLELARWLTSPDNPLTARVVVNRVWQAHFGEGLVRTPDNFGVRGERPTHPELLDWLALDFIRHGWDLKRLHHQIVTSATYRQGQAPAESASRGSSIDPENRLLSHFPRQRLEAEMVRDALLAVSGRLDLRMGGSLVAWVNNEYVPRDEVSENSVRRSLYLPIVRDRVYDVFTLFDFANPSVGTARRTPTVVSHQALFFLNSPLVKACARQLAAEMVSLPGDDDRRFDTVYQRCYGRFPTNPERERLRQFLAREGDSGTPEARQRTWAALCQTLLAANEFLYRE